MPATIYVSVFLCCRVDLTAGYDIGLWMGRLASISVYNYQGGYTQATITQQAHNVPA